MGGNFGRVSGAGVRVRAVEIGGVEPLRTPFVVPFWAVGLVGSRFFQRACGGGTVSRPCGLGFPRYCVRSAEDESPNRTLKRSPGTKSASRGDSETGNRTAFPIGKRGVTRTPRHHSAEAKNKHGTKS